MTNKEDDHNITITLYQDEIVPTTLHDVKISLWNISKVLSVYQLANLLDHFLNRNGTGTLAAHIVAEAFVGKHRTIQACLIRFCLKIISDYATIYNETWGGHTDARNEVAFETATKINAMLFNGELEYPPYI
jgi:hypothetical protein